MGFCFLTRNYGGIVIVIGVVPLVLVLRVVRVSRPRDVIKRAPSAKSRVVGVGEANARLL